MRPPQRRRYESRHVVDEPVDVDGERYGGQLDAISLSAALDAAAAHGA